MLMVRTVLIKLTTILMIYFEDVETRHALSLQL